MKKNIHKIFFKIYAQLKRKNTTSLKELSQDTKENIFHLTIDKYSSLNKKLICEQKSLSISRINKLNSMLSILEKIIDQTQYIDDHSIRGQIYSITKQQS